MIQRYLYTNGKIPRKGERLTDPNYKGHIEPPESGDYVGIFNGDYVKVDFDRKDDFNTALERCRNEHIKFNALKTSRGGHLYFRNVGLEKNRAEQEAVCGLRCEWKFSKSNETVPIKRGGVMLEWLEGSPQNSNIDELPEWLIPKAEICSTPLPFELPKTIPRGERDDILFKYASSLRAKGLEYYEILSALETVNRDRCKPILSDEQIEKICNQAVKYEKGVKTIVSPLSSHSVSELQQKQLEPIKWIVAKLIPQGLTLLAAPPKYGKSWFVLDLCLSVASGQKFLNYETYSDGCLYLALEDSEHRLKDRINKITFGEPVSGAFDYATTAQSIDNGLIEQLEMYIKSKPKTALIVIDTLQKVRGSVSNRDSAYANDYKEMSLLKTFADSHKICLLLVHHLRKVTDDDPFNRISGTTALSGAADTIMVMTKKKREDEETALHITGRDVEQNDYVMTFDKTGYKWRIKGLKADIETIKATEEYENNPIVQTIQHLVEQNSIGWCGTMGDLMEEIQNYTGDCPVVTEKALANKLKIFYPLLDLRNGIKHTAPGKNGGAGGRKHRFYKRHNVT